MLKYYVKQSTEEGYQSVTTRPRDNVWVHGDVVSENDLATLAHAYGFNLNILRDVLDKDELPRVELLNDGSLYVFVRSVSRGKYSKAVTTPVLLAVKDTVFINVSTATTDSHLPVHPSTVVQSTDTLSLLLGTLSAVVSDYEELMKRTSRYVHDTGRRLRTHEVTNDDFVHFVTVEDNLNEYAMNLNGMLVVAERLREALKESQDTEAVEDILLYIKQLVVAIDSYNQSIISIRNAYGTIANNVLNQRMKTLTVLTVLIALPNVFFGMYGMNVALPFQRESWVYGVILGFSVMVIFLVFWIAKRRGIF
jgi:magnesium transporter